MYRSPSFGAHFHDHEGEALIGGEATLVQLKRAIWRGGIADGRLVAGERLSALASVGLEAGYRLLGFSEAPTLVFASGGPFAAGQASFSLSFVFVHVYARLGYGLNYGTFGETALLFKLPARLSM